MKGIDFSIAGPAAIFEAVNKAMNEPPYPSMPWVLRDGSINCDRLVVALIEKNPLLAVVHDVDERLFATMSKGSFESLTAAQIDYIIRPFIPSGILTRLLLKDIKALLAASCPLRISKSVLHKDALQAFIALNCVRSESLRCRIRRAEFRKRYWQWCVKEGLPRPKMNELYQRMEEIGYPSRRTGGGYDCFIGLYWKPQQDIM